MQVLFAGLNLALQRGEIFDGRLVRVDKDLLPAFGRPVFDFFEFFKIESLPAGALDLSQEVYSASFSWERLIVALIFLNSPHGRLLLTIPDVEEEVEIVLGYTTDSVVYLEHELEAGKKEEYHLHVRAKGAWKRPIKIFRWDGSG
jgi:hypothetical protein